MSAPNIDAYTFGSMTVDGHEYGKDLIILNGKVHKKWRREKGHSLVPTDIPDILEARPELLVLGTGARGILKVPAETAAEIEAAGIELISLPTKKAVEKYNAEKDRQNTAGAFHLTC